MILELFMERMGERQGACLLDVGPILGANIVFFARRIPRLFVCDLFRHLHEALGGKRPPDTAWRHLEYPLKQFDGIVLWDFLDHLEKEGALRLIRHIRRWIKPKGMLVVFSRDPDRSLEPFFAFEVQKEFRLHPRPIPRLSLPLYPRQNRAVMALLPGFSSIKSFIYRNGVREYLFRFEKTEPDMS